VQCGRVVGAMRGSVQRVFESVTKPCWQTPSSIPGSLVTTLPGSAVPERSARALMEVRKVGLVVNIVLFSVVEY
jgi:hypothetical protein